MLYDEDKNKVIQTWAILIFLKTLAFLLKIFNKKENIWTNDENKVAERSV